MFSLIYSRRHRRTNEIRIINTSNRNLKIHCQSVLTDLRDQFVYESEEFAFNFYDFDPDNHHFWCDAYGLENFFETFDIFGKTAPNNDKIIWYLRPDGLYLNSTNPEAIQYPWWSWSTVI
uniref:S-protein homolog n=1 Tax=Panagrolaimus sp. PS1159 TaxID=55785 RepID=A0AC35F830_9BILA